VRRIALPALVDHFQGGGITASRATFGRGLGRHDVTPRPNPVLTPAAWRARFAFFAVGQDQGARGYLRRRTERPYETGCEHELSAAHECGGREWPERQSLMNHIRAFAASRRRQAQHGNRLPARKLSVALDRLRSEFRIADEDDGPETPGPLTGSDIDHVRSRGDLTDDHAAGAGEPHNLRVRSGPQMLLTRHRRTPTTQATTPPTQSASASAKPRRARGYLRTLLREHKRLTTVRPLPPRKARSGSGTPVNGATDQPRRGVERSQRRPAKLWRLWRASNTVRPRNIEDSFARPASRICATGLAFSTDTPIAHRQSSRPPRRFSRNRATHGVA